MEYTYEVPLNWDTGWDDLMDFYFYLLLFIYFKSSKSSFEYKRWRG